MRILAAFVFLFAVISAGGCSSGVDQDELVRSQKEINDSKGKGPDAWQD